jgi:hypothetical protein
LIESNSANVSQGAANIKKGEQGVNRSRKLFVFASFRSLGCQHIKFNGVVSPIIRKWVLPIYNFRQQAQLAAVGFQRGVPL